MDADDGVRVVVLGAVLGGADRGRRPPSQVVPGTERIHPRGVGP